MSFPAPAIPVVALAAFAVAFAEADQRTYTDVIVTPIDGQIDRVHYGNKVMVCYPVTIAWCANNRRLICPEDCQTRRTRRSSDEGKIRKDWQSFLEAIYWKDLRTQGISIGDPDSWRERRRKRWRKRKKST